MSAKGRRLYVVSVPVDSFPLTPLSFRPEQEVVERLLAEFTQKLPQLGSVPRIDSRFEKSGFGSGENDRSVKDRQRTGIEDMSSI